MGVKKTTKSTHVISYKLYSQKVLDRVHPKMKLDEAAEKVMDSMMNDFFCQITSEASRLVRTNNRKTLTERDIFFAMKLVFSEDLCQYAADYAEKAMILSKGGNAPAPATPRVIPGLLIDSVFTPSAGESSGSNVVYDNFASHITRLHSHSSPIISPPTSRENDITNICQGMRNLRIGTPSASSPLGRGRCFPRLRLFSWKD